MLPVAAGAKRKRSPSDNIRPTPQPNHPYLSGNFAPIHETLPLTPCPHVGHIPPDLADGEYVRNGSNPVSNDDLGRDAHWFDGDGMLSGVLFRRDQTSGKIEPEFVNQFVLTDLYLSTLASPRLRVPILPSIATLVNPLASIIYVGVRILRTLLLVILSHLPGSKRAIKKISVANTHIVYHDGRALATCESGPPIRIQLPGLETVGWYNGAVAEGEPDKKQIDETARRHQEKVLGQDAGLLSFMREWTTAHPKVDPKTKEMMMFHSSFAPPYVQYSIIPQAPMQESEKAGHKLEKMVNAAVPGVHGAKMMHDFGVSLKHTVIMDLPLTLDPINQVKGLPPVTYDSAKPSRFGVFPRRHPERVRWFETDASCIFHTANTWDDLDVMAQPTAVNMLCCRLTSATMVFASGNIAPPVEKRKKPVATSKRMPFFSKYDQDSDANVYERSALLECPAEEREARSAEEQAALDEELLNEDQCRLYYYHFDLHAGTISHQWALSAIPLEFPSVRPSLEMQPARFVYGCSTTTTSFGSALGKATKIDALVKLDTARLIARGQRNPPRSVTGIVDPRTMAEVLASEDAHDPIQVFCMPEGWYAQEPRFVPCSTSSDDTEDSGHLLFYAFDESQLSAATGSVPPDADASRRATSELWIVNAQNMTDVVARVKLPLRVPYGLHGGWFGAEEIGSQRPLESLRGTEAVMAQRRVREEGKGGWGMWARDHAERVLA